MRIARYPPGPAIFKSERLTRPSKSSTSPPQRCPRRVRRHWQRHGESEGDAFPLVRRDLDVGLCRRLLRRVHHDLLDRGRSHQFFENLQGDDEMPIRVGMDAIVGDTIADVPLAHRLQVLEQGRVGVDHGMLFVAQRQQPFRVFCQHLLVVALIRAQPRELRSVLRQHLGLERGRIERGGRHQHRLRPGVFDFCDQLGYAVLIFLEAFLAEGIIDAIVHAITDDDDIRLR